MEYEKIGQIYINESCKIIGRKPTKSNIISTAGSDNDIYLCNITQLDVINKLKKIMDVEDIINYNKTHITMSFYGIDLEFIFNINNQGRVSFRILGKNRLYGMLEYINQAFNINLDLENTAIMFNFEKYTIYFEDILKMNTIY